MKYLVTLLLLITASRAIGQDYGYEREAPSVSVQRMTPDLGMAAGSSRSRSYTEYNLGLNARFSDLVVWRNSFFGRVESGRSTIYGFDSILRWGPSFLKGDSGFGIFVGPGVRLPFQGRGAPLFEGGIQFKTGALTLGGGIKSLLHSVLTSGEEDDIQFFIFLSTGATL